jgi:plasmid stabilization system protein ParE
VSGYKFTSAARRDVIAIWEYIANDNLAAADRVLASVYHACDHVAQYPGSGHRREDLTRKSVRFWPVFR